MTDFATRVAQPLITAVPGVASAEVGGGQTLAMRIWIDPVKLAARGLSASDLAAALRANNVQSAPGQSKGKNTAIHITAATDLRGIADFRPRVAQHTSGGQWRLGHVPTVVIGRAASRERGCT